MPKTTKAMQKAVAKYMKANYYEMKVRVPKRLKQPIEARADSKGQSINGYVNALIRADMGVSEDEWGMIAKKKEG